MEVIDIRIRYLLHAVSASAMLNFTVDARGVNWADIGMELPPRKLGQPQSRRRCPMTWQEGIMVRC